MNDKEMIEFLENYQNWRRDQSFPSKYEQPCPTVLGYVLDKVIERLKNEN